MATSTIAVPCQERRSECTDETRTQYDLENDGSLLIFEGDQMRSSSMQNASHAIPRGRLDLDRR